MLKKSTRIPSQLFAVALVSTIAIEGTNPGRGFHENAAVLTDVRTSSFHSTNCPAFIRSFVNNTRNVRQGRPRNSTQTSQWSTWFPMERSELDAIEDCHEQPCAVKFGDDEVKAMAAVQKTDVDDDEKNLKTDITDQSAGKVGPAYSPKLTKFLSLVADRADQYFKTEKRSSYEYPGKISDPWMVFDQFGLKGADTARPSTPIIGLRILDFHNDKARLIRQLVDRRVGISPDRKEASLWIRDVYSDHYFDSWGEFGDIRCDAAKEEIVLTLAATIEFDVLKNTGLFASVSRGSAKSSMKAMMNDYLDLWAKQITDSAVGK